METNGRYKDERKRAKKIDLPFAMYGKIPPQARELEESTLGACMLEGDGYETAIGMLTPESFYVDAHQRIFRAFGRIHNRFDKIDILTVVEELKKTEELDMVGGPYAVTKLTNTVVSTANIVQHCKIVQEKFYKREVIRIAGEAIGEAYEDSTDVFDLLDKFSADASNIQTGNEDDFITMEQGLNAFNKEIERKEKIEGDIIGIKTGFTEIDKCTGGIQPGDLVTIGAGTGGGKTTYALNIAENAAKIGTPVAVFMLEVPKEQGVAKIVTSYTSSNFKAVRRGKLGERDKQTIKHESFDIRRLPIFINDKAGINYLQVRASLKRLMRKRAKERLGNGLDPNESWLCIIDYVQLMGVPANSRAKSREQELSETTKNLKAIAKDLGIGIILLAQVNKNVKGRKGNRLILGDIRDSAGVEMDSDIVLFIYEPDEAIDKMTRIAEIAKHRNGELLTTKLRVEFWRQKFLNPGDEQTPIPFNPATKNDEFDAGINAHGDSNKGFL